MVTKACNYRQDRYEAEKNENNNAASFAIKKLQDLKASKSKRDRTGKIQCRDSLGQNVS